MTSEKWITFYERNSNPEKEELFNRMLKAFFHNSEIIRYYEMLRESTACFNVIAKHEIEMGLEHFIINHVFDALALDYCISDWGGKIVIDVGSGAGLPGIPIYIIRKERNKSYLLESRRKKAEFLTIVVEKLSLINIQVVQERAEIAANDILLRENTDISLIRAVGGIEESLELTLPFVKVGGISVLYRGEISMEEREFSTIAGVKFGGKLENIVSYSLLGVQKRRNLLIYRKIEETNTCYPRRPGVPKRKANIGKSDEKRK